MKTKGVAAMVVILFIGALIIVGVSIAFGATFFAKPKKIETPLKENQSGASGNKTNNGSGGNTNYFVPSPSPGPADTTTTATSPTPPTLYQQPQGIYTISLPAEWITNSTFATSTYSTTKFTGPEGNVSVTFGSGKDPAGGCSEDSMVVLADRTIPGCFLLQKDGSRILTRAYTTDKAGLSLTIEGYINAPNKDNQQAVLGVIKTIDIR